MRAAVLIAALALGASPPAWAEKAEETAKDDDEITVPEPVSGRRTARPETITAADNLARVTLVHDNLELIRAYMGRPEPPDPLLQVQDASPREVFFQSYNLLRRARQLAYEQLRTPVPSGDLDMEKKTPADVLEQLDKALLIVLRVKRRLGIEEAVAERPRPDTTTASEVFNALVDAGQDLNVVLEQQTTSSDTFRAVTLAVNVASSLHAERTRRFLPPNPELIPNATDADTYRVLLDCFEKVRRLGAKHDIAMLRFDTDPEGTEAVTPDQVVELLAVILAELNYLHVRLAGRAVEFVPYYAGRRYPSHALQRARYLDAILAQLAPPEKKDEKKAQEKR